MLRTLQTLAPRPRAAVCRADAAALTAILAAAACDMAAAPPDPPKPVADTHDMINMPPTWAVKEQIAMLLYPGFTALDLIGPQYMFASLMGAVYLLRGYRATSHWVARDLLKYVGAIPVNQRVVEDRNRITGAGVTAGLDFDLRNL